MVAVYLHRPDLFSSIPARKHTFMKPGNLDELKNSALSILGGGVKQGHQVMKAIPRDTSFYQPDIQPFISDIIKNHGLEEWVKSISAI